MSIRKPHKKLYYSLRQTAEMLNASHDDLKSWEKHFTQISPSRDRAGNRHYTDKDIAFLILVRKLLLEDKMKLEEAQDFLKKNGKKAVAEPVILLRQAVAEARIELLDILEILKD